jgi:hypothetical protein
MAKHDLIAKGDLAFAQQMQLFKLNIGKYAVQLGLTPEQVAAQAADADYYQFVVQSQQMMLNHSQSWTALRKTLRKGDSTITDPAAKPGPDTLIIPFPAAVPPVAFGIEGRFRTLVRQVKASVNYNVGIGLELGIEAVDHAGPDFTTLQPKLTATVNGDHVELGWDWQGKRAFLDLCIIEVDRDDGKGFVQLVSSTRPGSKDKAPFPAVPTRWRYRAVYQVGDQPVGQWSNPAGIIVGM